MFTITVYNVYILTTVFYILLVTFAYQVRYVRYTVEFDLKVTVCYLHVNMNMSFILFF